MTVLPPIPDPTPDPIPPAAVPILPLTPPPWWKRKWVPWAALAVVTLSCMGIVDSANNNRTPTDLSDDDTSYGTTVVDTMSPEDEYISAIRDYVFVGTDAELLNAGYQACTAIDSNGSVEAVVWSLSFDVALSGSEVDMEMAGYVIAAATHHLCPEHLDSFNEFIDNN